MWLFTAKNRQGLLHFSEEESYVLNKAIYSIDEQSAIKENLVRKLRTLYSSRQFADTLIKDHLGKNIGILTDAIERKRQVVLYKYRSANTGKISDRTVEPFEFTSNHISVWCFDVDKKQNRLFKTARIGTAALNGKKWLYEDQHHSTETDIFRIGAAERIGVCIKLNMRARNLLCEEYPLAEKYVQDNGKGEYIFDHWVANFKGIGRFVLGLLDEVEVIAPKDFKDYLNEKLKSKRF